jgi:ABC-type sugar transport system substrate-binding protein
MNLKRRIVAIAAALAITAAGAVATAPAAAAACNLHIVYTLYPYADDYPYTTTSYTTYRYFVTHNLGTARYGWYC